MTYRLLIEYDGSAFCGWQRQHSQPSVQGALENALATAIRQPVTLVGAGRTDSGVHARGQTAHFRVPDPLDVQRLRQSLNGLTPKSIAIHAVERAPDDFHARFDALSRRYHYYVTTHPTALDRHYRYPLPHPVDFSIMNQAAAQLIGTHHFGAFCMTRSATLNRECTVTHARWEHESRPHQWRFEVEANRFLHGMVRAIVGTLLDIGRGKTRVEDFSTIMLSRDRRKAGPAAPAHGLVLETVRYSS